MKITNEMNLPDAIVEAIRRDTYDRGDSDISVTELLSPPRIVALQRHFHDKLVVDASDEIFALIGKIGHGILERAGLDAATKDGYESFQENRLFAPLVGWTVSGSTDALLVQTATNGGALLDDYKFTSAYVLKIHREGSERSRIIDWFKQINFYKWLSWKNGINVTRGRLILVLRDWSLLQAKRDKDFPQHQVAILEVPLKANPMIEEAMEQLVKRHQEAQQTMDVSGQDRLEKCSSSDCWEKPEKIAIVKEGRKSALRVLNTVLEAEDWAAKNDHATTVPTEDGCGVRVVLNEKIGFEHRPGELVRCENYCDVAEFCEQFTATKAR